MATLRKWWRDHSLTIVLGIIGLVSVGISIWLVWPVSRDRWFDLFSGFGIGALTVSVFYGLAGCYRERNKPEE